jgi:hypothetical protein
MGRIGIKEYLMKNSSNGSILLRWVQAVEALVTKTDPNILVWVNDNNNEVVLEGIPETVIDKLQFPVLQIFEGTGTIVNLSYVAVKTDKTSNNYLIISGLDSILSKHYSQEQALAQARGDNVFRPFSTPINGNLVPKLTDRLSELGLGTKTTTLSKTYKMAWSFTTSPAPQSTTPSTL